MKKIVTMLLMLSMLLMLAACAGAPKAAPTASQADETTTASTVSEETTPERRVITDGMDRNVEIPYSVERIVCVGVGALRYTCCRRCRPGRWRRGLRNKARHEPTVQLREF